MSGRTPQQLQEQAATARKVGTVSGALAIGGALFAAGVASGPVGLAVGAAGTVVAAGALIRTQMKQKAAAEAEQERQSGTTTGGPTASA